MSQVLLAIWIALAPLQTPRQELAVAALNEKVYAIGGLSGPVSLSSVEEYDPRTNSWRFVAPLPQPVHHPAAAALSGAIYVIGGYGTLSFVPTADVYRYDAAADRWSRVADLPSPRGALAAAAIGGKIYAVGGAPRFSELLVYDPPADRWSTLAPMPTPREHLAAVAFDGKLYVAGGRTSRNTNAFEVYDPATNGWTQLMPLPTARSGLAAAVLDGRIYVFGGEGNPSSASGVFSENESYDPASGQWRTETPMPAPRHGMGAATIGSRIFIPGGATVAGFGMTDVNDSFGQQPARRRAVRRGASLRQ